MPVKMQRRGTLAYISSVLETDLLVMQLADGAVLAMPFDEATVAPIDHTGVHTPTYEGSGLTSIADGPLGHKAYRFASSGAGDGRIQVADHASLDLGDVVTMECYFRPAAISGARVIMSKQWSPGAYAMWHNEGSVQLVKSQTAVIVESTVTVQDTGHWYHIVMTKNGATSKIWLDGVDRTGVVTNQTLQDNTDSFVVGLDELQSEVSGDIAFVALYPTALSAGQVAAHFAATS